MALTPSNEIINGLRRQLGLDDITYAVMRAWEHEAGALLQGAELIGIQKGKLIVAVANSVYFQELMLRKRDLIKKINQYTGGEKVVKDIKLQLKSKV
jgi:hypothetical protein